MKVLAIDDSEPTLSLIRDILTMQKHEVQVAASGADGVKKFAEFRPDVVTLDLAMPEMDGYAVLQRILEMDPDATVVTITAVGSKEMMERSIRMGAARCMPKPFSPSELVQVIDELGKILKGSGLPQQRG